MNTHRFDPISLVLGLLAIAAGIGAANGSLVGVITKRPDTLVPLLLMVAGVVAIAMAARRSIAAHEPAGVHESTGLHDDLS